MEEDDGVRQMSLCLVREENEREKTENVIGEKKGHWEIERDSCACVRTHMAKRRTVGMNLTQIKIESVDECEDKWVFCGYMCVCVCSISQDHRNIKVSACPLCSALCI